MQRSRGEIWQVALLLIALAVLVPGSASAELTGRFTRFQHCPYENLEVKKCLFSEIDGGEIILGKREVPIIDTVTLQGGYGKAVNGFAPFFAAKGDATLSKTPQPVPGGLAGIVPPESSSPLVNALSALFFENAISGVNASLELAGSVSDIKVSENNFGGELGTALRMPIKFRLENPLLGSSCYIGSEKSPIIWELTTATTKPPAPNKPIKGSAGFLEFLDEASNLVTKEAKLVDNAWSAPAARGCGGFLSFLIDPILNEASGLPAKAGTNTAILISDSHIAATGGVRINDIENP